MSKTAECVQELERRYRTTNGKELAKLLGVAEMSVSRYRNGQKGFADDVALKAAELLDIQGEILLAELQEERATDEKSKKAWRKIADRMRHTSAVY